MKKELGLLHLIFYGTGMILGAGIYSIIGKAAGIAEEGLWLSFLLAALSASLTALSYAELATTYPRTGAEFIYLKNIFPQYPFLAMFCGSVMIFAGICTATTLALAFSGYMQQFLPSSQMISSFAVLGFLTLVNILGIKESSWVNILFTLIEIAGLIMFISVGVRSPDFGGSILNTSFNSAIISGAALVMFSYFGFENIVNLVEEAKQPEKHLPKAIIISLVISTILYLLVSLAALALGTPDEMKLSDAPLSDLSKKSAPLVANALGGIALFSTANTVLISMISTSRVIFSMARENELPNLFSRLSVKKRTPWIASLTVFLLATVLLPLGRIEVVASASSFATMTVFFLINMALIYHRIQAPDVHRAFKVPLSIGGVPIPTVFAAIISFGMLFFFIREVYLLSAVVYIAIWVVYKFH